MSWTVQRRPTRSVQLGSAFPTSFPTVENPLSQNGIWQLGANDGVQWNNPEVTAAGRCVGSAVVGASPPDRFRDDIAHLKTSYQSFLGKQYAQGTVYLAAGYTGNGGSHEIELLLDFSISANDAHGYECIFGMNPAGQGYVAVVRWNGAVGDFTALYDPGSGSIPFPADGDVFRAEHDGSNNILVYRNGVLLAKSPTDFATDTTFTSGQPGLGFWPADGAIKGNYGWKVWDAGNLP